jgi:hypothetical protein
MQLRSGRTTLTNAASRVSSVSRVSRNLRRNSRNYEEFDERRRYQQEQKLIEESIYDSDTNEEQDKKIMLKLKWKNIARKTKHLLYLSECQRKNKCSFTEKVKTIKEIYEMFLYNMDDMIELFNGEMKHKKKFPQMVYDKGNELCADMNRRKRTRAEIQLANECNDLINHVTQLIYRFILTK